MTKYTRTVLTVVGAAILPVTVLAACASTSMSVDPSGSQGATGANTAPSRSAAFQPGDPNIVLLGAPPPPVPSGPDNPILSGTIQASGGGCAGWKEAFLVQAESCISANTTNSAVPDGYISFAKAKGGWTHCNVEVVINQFNPHNSRALNHDCLHAANQGFSVHYTGLSLGLVHNAQWQTQFNVTGTRPGHNIPGGSWYSPKLTQP